MIKINYDFIEKYAEITENFYKSINEENKKQKDIIEFIKSLKELIEYNHNLVKEKQELIDYLKKEINKINKEIEHYDLWHEAGTDINFLILRKQMFKEILSKIENK